MIIVIKSIDRLAYKISTPFDILALIALILSVYPLAQVQKAFNHYWNKTQKLPVNSKFSLTDYLIMFFGLIILIVTSLI